MKRLRNARTGVIVTVDDVRAETLGSEFGPVGVKVADPEGPFDPSTHKADEVLAYVAGLDDADPEAHDAEVSRVVEAERAGKARKSVLEAVEGAPAGDADAE